MTRLATWNPERGVWETDALTLCGHHEPFTDTWPTAGHTRAGVAHLRPPLPAESRPLLPTPRASADRTGRSAAVRQDSMSGPSLGQAIEIANGVLPREFTTWDELPGSWQPVADRPRLLPTPTASDGGGDDA